MDISFKCDTCGQNVVADEAGAGSVVECPKCKASLIIPQSASAIAATRKLSLSRVIVEEVQGLPLKVTLGKEPVPVEIVGLRLTWGEAFDVTVKVFCCLSAFTLLLAFLAAIFAWTLRAF